MGYGKLRSRLDESWHGQYDTWNLLLRRPRTFALTHRIAALPLSSRAHGEYARDNLASKRHCATSREGVSLHDTYYLFDLLSSNIENEPHFKLILPSPYLLLAKLAPPWSTPARDTCRCPKDPACLYLRPCSPNTACPAKGGAVCPPHPR